MKAIVTRLAQEIIDEAGEIGIVAEQLRPGAITVSTSAYLQEAKESLQRALDTLKMKLDIEPRREP